MHGGKYMKTHKGYRIYPLTKAQTFHFYYLDKCPKKEVVNVGTSLTIEYERISMC